MNRNDVRGIGWALNVLSLVLMTGCGKVPTREEITKGKGTTPTVAAPSQTPEPTQTITPPPIAPVEPQKQNPEEVIARFKKLAPGQWENGALTSLCSLEEGLELVTEINASGSQVTDEGLNLLHKLTSLQSLELVGTNVGDKGCAAISQVPSLETLTLTGSHITDSGISHLTNLPQLKKLVINGTRLSPEGWVQVGKMPALEVLWIQQSSLDDDALDAICEASTLRSIWMNDTSVTDRGLVSLRKLEVLTHLNLSGCPIHGDGLAGAIKGNGLKTLINISVQRTALNDKGAAAIGSIKTLEELNIAGLQGMQDKHLAMMVKSKKALRYLNMNGNRGLSNDSLKALANLTELEELMIGDIPGMNNQGLAFLKKLEKLRHINYGGTGITPAGIEKLQEFLPELNRSGSRSQE